MNTYRVGYKENAIGTSWYSCEKKFLGLWIETETFKSEADVIRYAKYLENQGHYVINVNIHDWHKK